jgi:hydrogenase/urease accessory protein HupE
MKRLLIAAALCWVATHNALAHESLPGYLEIFEQSRSLYQVFWRIPAIEGVPPAIAFEPPPACHVVGGTNAPLAPGSLIENWTMRCERTLIGQTIDIAGLDRTLLDVLVRVKFQDGTEVSHIVRPLESSFVLDKPNATALNAREYFVLGIEHILYGVDHLLFVLGLLLLVRSVPMLLKTITAFTVSHTITLSLAAFGFVHVPAHVTEAVIALSIVFLAYEMTRKTTPDLSLARCHPWVVAFAFGLLHGFGFAGTLARLGLPRHSIPLALLLFNCGVEVGQLAAVVTFLTFVWCLRQLEIPKPRWTDWGLSYGFGSVASFWFIQRCVNLF